MNNIDKMEAFANHEVVPDVIDTVPPKQLQLKYGDVDVVPGQVLTPTQVKDPPTVQYDTEDGAYYTLIMNDPDAPSRENPKFREWHHWRVVNIPGCDVNKGDITSEYIGAGPPKGTGLHRYVFLVYKQPSGKIQLKAEDKFKRTTDGRGSHKMREFTTSYGLKDHLIAGNFFQAEWDDYVPKLYQEISPK